MLTLLCLFPVIPCYYHLSLAGLHSASNKIHRNDNVSDWSKTGGVLAQDGQGLGSIFSTIRPGMPVIPALWVKSGEKVENQGHPKLFRAF